MRDEIDRGDEPEELLAAGRPLPQWARPAGAALVVLVGGYLAVHAISGDATHKAAALPTAASASHSSQIAPPLFRQPGGPRMLPAWPTARGACGDRPQLALVSGQQPARGTGLTVLVSGAGVRRVTLDTGARTTVHTPLPALGAYVDQLAGSTGVGYPCLPSQARVFTLGTRTSVTSPSGSVDLYQDGRRTYLVRDASSGHPVLTTPGRPSVRLPRHFDVVGVTHGVVAGSASVLGHYVGMLLDAATGRLRMRLSQGQPVAAGGGQVISLQGCDVSRLAACTLRRTAVSGGATRSYTLPRPPAGLHGVLSPDGREFAFLLERAHQDRRYSMGYPLPPSDIAWLHLDTGRVDVVPGVELPGKVGLALAFAPHSDWLVAALDGGRRTRLLAWHPGLVHPEEATPIVAPTTYSPGLEVTRG
jgi:hypothetical protein